MLIDKNAEVYNGKYLNTRKTRFFAFFKPPTEKVRSLG